MFNRLMKDSGVEWAGNIPNTWTMSRIKHNFVVYSGATPKSDNELFWDGDIKWITPADFKTNDVYVSSGNRNITKEGYNSCGTTIVPRGSIVFSKRAPIGSVALLSDDMCTNQGCLSCVPKKHVDSKFYYYQLSVLDEQFNLYGTGTTFKEISYDNFINFRVVLPTFDEQARIADFLDKKISEIDAVISRTKESIEEYKKLKQSIITETVTKGLDPNVEMKDSGVEWIGEVPMHWGNIKIGRTMWLRNEKSYLPLDQVNLISLYTDKGVVQHDDLEETTGNKAQNANGYKKVYENDIVVNIILAWMGAIGVSKYDGVTSPAYDVYKPNAEIISPRYCHYLFRTTAFSGECYKYGRGIMMMRWRTYSNEFKQIKIPFPPLKEQKEIASYLDNRCSKYDSLISKKEQVITELEQYKKSLIYEYVTGKKEVA